MTPPPRVSVVVAALVLLSPAALAASPVVEFDVTTVIACHDVTTAEFAVAHPQHKLLQATFNISSLFRRGTEKDVAQFLYRIESTGGTLRIVDHLPRTELASPVVGPIAVEKKDESTKRIGGLLGGQYPPFSQAEISGQAGTTNGLSVRYEMLPPKELLAASGTLNRERGVYFKLRPSPQTSLEGARQFVCVLRVPRSWRADCVRLDCRADGCGHASFLVGLFAAGDEEARLAVEHLVACDERLMAQLRCHPHGVVTTLFGSRLPGFAPFRAWMRPAPLDVQRQHLLQRHAQGALSDDVPAMLRCACSAFAEAEMVVRALSRQPFDVEVEPDVLLQTGHRHGPEPRPPNGDRP